MFGYEFWEGVNYMLELFIACSMFIFLLEKRSGFWIRYISATVIGLVLGGFIWEQFMRPAFSVLSFLFWAAFFIFCIPYLMLCCSLSISEAVYCSICGFAIQHFASESCLLFKLVVGEFDGILAAYALVYLVIYILFYHIFVKKLVENGKVDFRAKKSALSLIALILIVLIISVIKKHFYTDDTKYLGMVCQIYDMFCCAFILWGQVSQKEALHLQHELDYMDYMWHQQQDQYQLTQENIDIINRKCHDLKHQIRALSDMQNGEQKDAFISNIEEAIMIYDASIDTGNKALDTVIMEKSLFCKEHGITLSCIADGTKLDFMDIIDLYTIFGNALDNAIESVDKLEDKEKKVVVVKVFTKDELLMIQVENYLDSELVFQNELPVTTKEEKYFHGFGIKSIQYTVHKYNGCITINTDRRLFQLQILIPLQK
jgi:hypothetical protein